MFGGLLIIAAAAAAADEPEAKGPLFTFKDWTVGCDNGLSCMAVGQFSPTNYDLASVVVERGPGADDLPLIWFRSEDDSKVVDLAADGKPLGVKLLTDSDEYNVTVDFDSAAKVVAAMTSAKTLVPVRADGKKAYPLSISGASAALRWMDEQQKRAGTVTALVAKGSKPASAIPAPPALPVVTAERPSGDIGKPLTKDEIAKIQEEFAECTDEDLDNKVEYARIDGRTTLAIVTAVCGSGAYNYYGIPMLIRDDGTREVADLDKDEGDLTMNLSWDGAERVLSSYFKGRGLGDCGGGNDWVWDGKRFRVVKTTLMDECRGAITWIPVYRAKVVTE